MRIERVLVEEALGADLWRAGAAEAVDHLGRRVLLADLALGGELLGPHARAQLDVEDEGGHAGHLEGNALVTAVEEYGRLFSAFMRFVGSQLSNLLKEISIDDVRIFDPLPPCHATSRHRSSSV